ncbi:hypothetical protein [Flexithrix dorotheae]|uniref:hypothetical protein n=1 Tax=Flexithrix dorotheae TaxID=70993 RepID=UPI0003692D36|nr:hypothetical protein [Flexithrix dorotheae]
MARLLPFPISKYFRVLFFTVFFGCWQNLVAQENDTIPKDNEVQNFLSQTRQGKGYLGFNFGIGLGFRNENLTFSNSTVLVEVNFMPTIGIFVFNGLLIGASYDNFNSVASFGYQDFYALYLQNINFTTRYYTKGGLFLEGQLGVGQGNENFKRFNNETINEFDSKKIAFGIGLANFWTRKFNFELMLKYSVMDAEYNSISDDFSLNGLRLSAGISYSLGKY